MALNRTTLILAGASVSAAAGLCASGASAGVETMHSPRNPDRNCEHPHDVRAPGYLWGAKDGPLRFGGEGTQNFEFYGHTLDMAPSVTVDVPGIAGEEAERVQGHAGFINASRGCGGIGSIVVKLTLPAVETERRGTLQIGLDEIPFVIVPRLMERAVWHEANVLSQGTSRGGSSGSPAPNPLLYRSSNQANCTGQGCPANTGNSLVIVSAGGGGGASSGAGRAETFTECMKSFGVETSLVGDRLTVTLPRQRAGASAQCFNRPFLARASSDLTNIHGFLPGASDFRPTYNVVNPQDGPRMTAASDGDSRVIHTLRMSAQDLQNLAGEYRYGLSVRPSENPNELELIIKSDPAYGVKQIVSPVRRLNNTSGLTVHPHQRVKAGQAFFWRVTSTTPGLAAQCFSSVEGTERPSAGSETFVLPTNIEHSAACRQPFSVTVKPAMFANDPAFDNGAFGKTLAFTPAMNEAMMVQPGRTLTSRAGSVVVPPRN